jgi:hexosaminidase
VAYAQSKYIQILPEIDVPGHSLAILTAYPELSCAGGNKFQINAGWKFYRDVENSLCPSNEKVYEFLDKVFGEVAELFPHPTSTLVATNVIKDTGKKVPNVKL